MSMPIGVGIVIDDQLRLNQNDQKDGAKGQSQQDQKDTTGTVANQNQPCPKGNEGTARDTNQQNQADNENISAHNSNQDQDNDGDAINNIVRQLEEANVPLVKYTDIPSTNIINNFGQVAFLLLDWKLLLVESLKAGQSNDPSPVQTGDTQQQKELERTLSFIEEFHKICFAPVLLFTNEDIDGIKEKLVARNLYQGDKTDFIFIQRKAELKSVKGGKNVVVETVSNWVQSTPVTHLVSEWNRSVVSAQSRMFADFFSGSHEWPKHLWQAYKADGANPDAELTSMIAKNMFARINCQFDEATMSAPLVTTSATNNVMAFLELAISVPNRSLNPKHGGGDVFFLQATPEGKARDYPYLLNISCDCDFVRNNQFNALFIGGKVIDSSKALESNGSLKRPLSKAYILPIHGGKCICFEFGQHEILQPCKLALESRICRLTVPYLTDIRQRYANWIHREGLPVYPH